MARVFFADSFTSRGFVSSFGIMLATMLVDLDHLLATPVYDPLRCSMGFHPLHSFFPVLLYLVLCFVPKLRLVGIGLVIHMALDSIDCLTMSGGAGQLLRFLPFV